MNELKKQLDHFAHGFASISRAQKISGGVLVTLVIVTFVMFKQHEAAEKMQPILDQKLSADESKQIIARLEEQGIPHKLGKDKKILVPAERKIEVLADLGYEDLLPGDTERGFDKMIDQMSPFDSSSKSEMMYRRAKDATLAKIIGRFPGVKSAVVVMDTPTESRIGETSGPTATVNIFTQGEVKDVDQLAAAAASVLAGAQADLRRDRIAVTIDGVLCAADYAKPKARPDGFELKQKISKELAAKVTEHLHIEGVLVSVTADTQERAGIEGGWYGPSLLTTTQPAEQPAKRRDTIVTASV